MNPGFVSLACVATNTHRARPEDNQDAAAIATVPPGGLPAVILADGLGSFAYAGEAARFAAEEARHALETRDDRPRGIDTVFSLVQAHLADFASARLAAPEVRAAASPDERPDPTRAFGTTLLVAAETPDGLLVAYAGNGGVFHIRGNFTDFGTEKALPWSFVNCLNPHSVSEEGREALYRYLSPTGGPEQAEPTVLLLRKDRRFGDILLLCTDGLFSPDQVRYGSPGDGSVWGEVDEPLIAFHTALRACFAAEGHLTRGRLQQAMDDYLAGLRARRALDDDTTLGLIVTARALAYRRERQEKPRGDAR
jgi:serine/threonine protein phosphatase PrpC